MYPISCNWVRGSVKRLLVGNSLLGCEDVNEKLKIKLVICFYFNQ